MDTAAAMTSSSVLPAQRRDAAGRARVDVRAIVALAAPFAANSAIQSVLNLTDTWFIGRISTTALAAIAAIHWPVIVCIALFGGVGLAGQTIVAQACGGRRRNGRELHRRTAGGRRAAALEPAAGRRVIHVA